MTDISDRVLRCLTDGGLGATEVSENPPSPGEFRLRINPANLQASTSLGDSDHILASVSGTPKKITRTSLLTLLSALGTRVVTVGAGAQCATIAAGLSAAAALTPTATSRVLVLVSPGTYVESRLDVPDYVDLAGVDRDGCIIAKDDGTDQAEADDWIGGIVRIEGNSLISSLTIRNLHNDYVSTAIIMDNSVTGKTVRIKNCILDGGANAWDVVVFRGHTDGNNTVEVEDCTILGASDVLACYVQSNSVYSFRRCTIKSLRTGGASGPTVPAWLAGSGKVFFVGCELNYIESYTSTRGGAFRGDQSRTSWGTGLKIYVLNSAVLGPSSGAGMLLDSSENDGGTWVIYPRRTTYAKLAETGVVTTGVTINSEDLGSGDKSTLGTITADAFVGDGSGLTDLPGVPDPLTLDGLVTSHVGFAAGAVADGGPFNGLGSSATPQVVTFTDSSDVTHTLTFIGGLLTGYTSS